MSSDLQFVERDIGLSRADFAESPPVPWKDTELYRKWRNRTHGNPVNDFLIVVTASSKTSGSGSGKTTVATKLAELCDQTDEGFDADERGTVDAGDLAYNVMPETPFGAAVMMDEGQGTPGSKSVNARRGMTTEALDAINSVLAARDQAPTVVMVGQQLKMLDSLFYHMIDAWLLIVRDPSQEGGPVVVHHELATDDYDLNNRKIKTPAIEDLTWDPLPEDNENYTIMQEKKHAAKYHSSEDEEGTPVDELPKPIRDEKIKDLYENGVGQGVIANTFDLTQPMVSNIVNDKA